MPEFTYNFTVNASPDAVAAFHNDTSALRKLSPPPIFAQLHKIEPLAEGSVSEFTLWFGPVPVRWKAVHSQVSAAGFTDTQVTGPLKSWRHTHLFSAIDDEHTEIRESIRYAHPAGLRGLFTRLVFGKPGLWALFTYRKLATRRALENQNSRPGWIFPTIATIGITLTAIMIGYWIKR